MNVGLRVIHRHSLTGEAARTLILELAQQCGSPAWSVAQSFEKAPQVEAWSGEHGPENTSFQGRIFGPKAEVRWMREGAVWEVWHVAEQPGREYVRLPNPHRYYLWGIAKRGMFSEDRIPGVKQYPLASPPVDDDRAYIEVVEYWRNTPMDELVEPDALSLLMEELNQSYAYTHRFAGFGCGETRHG